METMTLKHLTAIFALAFLALPAWAEGIDVPPPQVSEEAVKQAIKSYVDTLWQGKDAKIYWELNFDALSEEAKTREKRYWGGRTALGVLALLYAGEDPQTDRMQEILKWLAEIDMEATYITGIRSSVWSKLHKPEYKPLLARDAKTLMGSTMRNGKISGYFSYMPAPTSSSGGDHSNTQFGVLGMWAAATARLETEKDYWKLVNAHWLKFQRPDGVLGE